jgi:hypothetical protein
VDVRHYMSTVVEGTGIYIGVGTGVHARQASHGRFKRYT